MIFIMLLIVACGIAFIVNVSRVIAEILYNVDINYRVAFISTLYSTVFFIIGLFLIIHNEECIKLKNKNIMLSKQIQELKNDNWNFKNE